MTDEQREALLRDWGEWTGTGAARQKAEELHVALANTEVRPTQPVAFARAEAHAEHRSRKATAGRCPHGGCGLHDPGAF